MWQIEFGYMVQAIISAFSIRACTQIQFAALYSMESRERVQALILNMDHGLLKSDKLYTKMSTEHRVDCTLLHT